MGQVSVSRRTALQGMGVGALGLSAAALLGCGSGNKGKKATGQIAAQSSGQVVGATAGHGLPKNAPVVQGTPKDGGTYLGGVAANQTQHDPHTTLGASVWDQISEKGLNCDVDTGALKPAIFTSWEVADPSGLTLVMKVSNNLFMAPTNKPPWNGRQFDATDAAWNLERIGGLYADRLKIPLANFQRASMVDKIVKAEAVDQFTVKITLSKPNSAFFNGLWDTRVMFAPKEMDDVGWIDPMKMAGPGAWMITEWTPNVRSAFAKNPNYTQLHQGEPHFAATKAVYLSDLTAQQSAFISGQSAAITIPDPPALKTVRQGKPDANLYTWVDSNWEHLRFSMTYKPFQDFRVRQALHLAEDYKANGDAEYGADGGWAYQAALCPGYPEAWGPDKVQAIAGYNPATKQADIADAVKMLAAAGFPNGKGIEFAITPSSAPGTTTNDNSLRAQNYWLGAFPDMKVTQNNLPPGAAFANAQAEGRFDMVSYVITAAPDAFIEMYSQYDTRGSRNYGQFSNPDLDSILDKAEGELNKDARTQLFETFQEKWISDWRPMLVLHANAVKTLVQGNIAGYDKQTGIWHGYRSTQEIRLLQLMDNGVTGYQGG